MRFMVLRMADRQTEAGMLPDEKLLAVMGKYMEDLGKAGVLLGGEGLKSTSSGARVKFSRGKPRIIDGPFTESKELIGGYLLLQVKSREEAIEWAKRWPPADAEGELLLEIRQLFEAEDFGAEFTPELRAQEERLRAEAARR